MGFAEVLAAAPLGRSLALIQSADADRVERALAARVLSFEDFLALLSPVAGSYLEPLAHRAERVTRERFGRVVQLYAPLYVSNECTNRCVYCGFNRDNPVRRATLTLDEAEADARLLWEQGFRSLLLVSGEAPSVMSVDGLEAFSRRLHPLFPSLAVEVYPVSVAEYAKLADAGVDGVTIYQETYDTALYASVHPSGRKRDFAWRLETPGRAGEAGMRRVGLGALLGLGPWRREAVALALHAAWLQKTYWRTQVSISFPRLRQAAGGYAPAHPMSHPELVQMACALRLFHPDVALSLSTREPAAFRDGFAPICITHMSAGSRTEPGGYTHPGEAEEQFRIADERTPAQVAAMLLSRGLEPVWKDWDGAFTRQGNAA